jgi:hypothetical protein
VREQRHVERGELFPVVQVDAEQRLDALQSPVQGGPADVVDLGGRRLVAARRQIGAQHLQQGRLPQQRPELPPDERLQLRFVAQQAHQAAQPYVAQPGHRRVRRAGDRGVRHVHRLDEGAAHLVQFPAAEARADHHRTAPAGQFPVHPHRHLPHGGVGVLTGGDAQQDRRTVGADPRHQPRDPGEFGQRLLEQLRHGVPALRRRAEGADDDGDKDAPAHREPSGPHPADQLLRACGARRQVVQQRLGGLVLPAPVLVAQEAVHGQRLGGTGTQHPAELLRTVVAEEHQAPPLPAPGLQRRDDPSVRADRDRAAARQFGDLTGDPLPVAQKVVE